jgi:hypothetical protein
MAKLPEGRAKDAYIRVRLTPADKEKIKTYAEQNNMTMTEVIEELINRLVTR